MQIKCVQTVLYSCNTKLKIRCLVTQVFYLYVDIDIFIRFSFYNYNNIFRFI